ncbi:NUDIX hydrolase [Hoeflea prorocentri]|uniref:NAD regulator n=1 Tax=Hoeflea prorocentri TaxID=1922333 RepID=A0A9X3ZI79_9HYPH|nr:NAD regulator [Hoeflea prorocentri]MCY6381450.1 NAD regulator [Hoeflea prorocentri]MDA5399250.1 NAD regulator [Hoeflea prorocentri]
MDTGSTAVEIGLNAAIVTVEGGAPQILVVSKDITGDDGTALPDGLPLGSFDPLRHGTFETGLRASVEEQTALHLGYVEQLYTFGDRGRHKQPEDVDLHIVSVGYLALTRNDGEQTGVLERNGALWRNWYGYLPWEDWRSGRPDILDETILPALSAWATRPEKDRSRRLPNRHSRLRLAFGQGDFPWDEERVLERYELLYEAGLVEEAVSDGRIASTDLDCPLGRPMRFDHRRILATAMARLRGKLKYRPVIFELMPPEFTLTDLQSTVEAISGRHLHKQNFRRLVEGAQLVESTGATSTATGGRPAALYRFRREILEERPAPGIKFGGR